MKIKILIFLAIGMNLKVLAQPTPFYGTLFFNLIDYTSRNYLTTDDFKSGALQLLTYNSNSELTYDTSYKAFSFRTMGFESKEFAIVYNNDTTYINYPSKSFIKAVYIKMPIPLNGMKYSFNNQFTYDAMNSNHYLNNLDFFYLCHGCFIIETYGLTKEINSKINKEYFKVLLNDKNSIQSKYYNKNECDSMMKADSLVLIYGFKGNQSSYSTKYGHLLKADGEFKKGYLYNGKYYIYNCEGILTRKCIFKNGKYFADGQIED